MTQAPIRPSESDSPMADLKLTDTAASPQRRRPTRAVTVTRLPERFMSNDRRVITRFFNVGGENRTLAVIKRVLDLDESDVELNLKMVIEDFAGRHRNIGEVLERHFDQIKHYIEHPNCLSEARRQLIGSYFTMEYSIESAALFNPSVAPHPDQSNLPEGAQRFIMSLRATGEGHVSSIVFRTGIIDAEGHVHFDPSSKYASKLRAYEDKSFNKRLFFLKLIEMAAYSDAARVVLDELPDEFTIHQLDHKLAEIRERPGRPSPFSETAENMLWLARSNYTLKTAAHADASDIVIFPTSENESRGIEDCRLTQFIDDDGEATYFGTYTAYNGFRILPQLLETRDFHTVEVHTLNGKYVQNKGMALFPRKINGMYYMLGRIDGENNYLLESDNPHFWNEAKKIQTPEYAWEFVQIGNCGPPIETEAGWLVLTHGVGPMRKYCIGASLLDINDPYKVIGHLPEPLLVPEEDERDGYVPNVVYSCGSLVHGDQLFMPYAMSDSACRFAMVNLPELLEALVDGGALPN